MTAKHHLTHAEQLFWGAAYYEPAHSQNGRKGARITPASRVLIGAPDAADADGVAASQSVGAGASFTVNGALASGGVATFDVPRNVVAAWTDTAVVDTKVPVPITIA